MVPGIEPLKEPLKGILYLGTWTLRVHHPNGLPHKLHILSSIASFKRKRKLEKKLSACRLPLKGTYRFVLGLRFKALDEQVSL